jgi:hypothetical protein
MRGITANYSLTIQDLAINTAPVTSDLVMIAVVRLDSVTPSAGQTFTFERFNSTGWNFGLDIAGVGPGPEQLGAVTIRDCNISTSEAPGSGAVSNPINVRTAASLTVENCVLSGDGNNDHGIYLIGVRKVLIANNTVQNNGDSSIKILTGGFGTVGSPLTITGATNATPIVITSVAHGLTSGSSVAITGVGGNTAANGSWAIIVIDADHFSLDTSTGNGAYTSGGSAVPGTVCDVGQDYGGWVVRDNIIQNSNKAFAFYSYCTSVIPTIVFGGNKVYNMTDMYTGDGAMAFVVAACGSSIEQTILANNTWQNLTQSGLFLQTQAQTPQGPCSSATAQGNLNDFISTGERYIAWSTLNSGTYPAITTSGGSLLRASVSHMNADGQTTGRAALNLTGFQQYSVIDLQEKNITAAVSPHVTLQQPDPAASILTLQTSPSCTGDPIDLIDSMGAAHGSLTCTGYPNFPGTGGVYFYNDTLQPTAHILHGHFTMTTGAATVTLSGRSVYTDNSSWDCGGANTTNTDGFSFSIPDGSHLDIAGTGSDTIAFVCAGN